jgi:hypothetical protein
MHVLTGVEILVVDDNRKSSVVGGLGRGLLPQVAVHRVFFPACDGMDCATDACRDSLGEWTGRYVAWSADQRRTASLLRDISSDRNQEAGRGKKTTWSRERADTTARR